MRNNKLVILGTKGVPIIVLTASLVYEFSMHMYTMQILEPVQNKILTVLRKHMFSRRAPTVPKKEMIKINRPTAIITAAGSVEMLENSL